MRLHCVLAACLAAGLFYAQPAFACRVPVGWPALSVVISSPPDAIPEGAVVIHGRFMNTGPEFDRFFAELPVIPGEPVTGPDGQISIPGEMLDEDLVGVLVSDAGFATPIYDTAWCSDAHPSFTGPIDQEAWVVGRFFDRNDIHAFSLASRDYAGGWDR